MRPRVLAAVACLLGLTAFAPLPFPRPSKPAQVSLEGEWEVLSHPQASEADRWPAVRVRVRIGKSELSIDEYHLKKMRGATSSFRMKLNPKAAPPTIDLELTLVRGVGLRGIYKIEGDLLTLSFMPAGRNDPVLRPAGFALTMPEQSIMVLRRRKRED